MSFTAKVKKTGQVFNATNEWEEDGSFGRDAHDLVDGKLYGGHLFHTHELRESADLVDLVFSGIEWKTFKAEELQKFAANRIRLAVAQQSQSVKQTCEEPQAHLELVTGERDRSSLLLPSYQRDQSKSKFSTSITLLPPGPDAAYTSQRSSGETEKPT